MQAAWEIRVGDRTVIGVSVKVHGETAYVDHSMRKGIKGEFVGGDIFIGEGHFIDGDVIILPFRRIARGAVIGAGSVVTKLKNTLNYTVVAGNPAKFIGRLDHISVKEHAFHDIQQQDEHMLKEMPESANRQLKHCIGCLEFAN